MEAVLVNGAGQINNHVWKKALLLIAAYHLRHLLGVENVLVRTHVELFIVPQHRGNRTMPRHNEPNAADIFPPAVSRPW